MSDESYYFKKGQDRGYDDKDKPLSGLNLANEKEQEAARRGWEAGQTARKHKEAIEDAIEEERIENIPSPAGGPGDDFIASLIFSIIAIVVGGFIGLAVTNGVYTNFHNERPPSGSLMMFGGITGAACGFLIVFSFFDKKEFFKGLGCLVMLALILVLGWFAFVALLAGYGYLVGFRPN